MEIQRPIFLPSLLLLLLLILKATATVGSSPEADQPASNGTDFIHTSCAATTYPDDCLSSLSPYAAAIRGSHGQLARLAVSVSLTHARLLVTHLSNLSAAAQKTSAVSASAPSPAAAEAAKEVVTVVGPASRAKGPAAALRDCVSTVKDAAAQMKESLAQMRLAAAAEAAAAGGSSERFRFLMGNTQTYMSAALTDEETCTDGFGEVEECPVKDDVGRSVAEAERFTSNALALVNHYVDSVLNAAAGMGRAPSWPW